MKILQVIQKPQYRGAEIFACQLSVELIKLGHEVDVLFLFGANDQQLPYPLHFIHLNATIKKRFWDFKAYAKLNDIILKGNYDIVQANAADTLKYTVMSKYIYNWKSKLVYRNANKMSDFLTTKSRIWFNKLLIRKVDAVASVSMECMIDFISCYPTFQKAIECLPIGVSIQSIVPYESLKSLGILGKGPFLLHVASFVSEKNHAGLVRIFSKIVPDFPSAQLLLIGEGKLKESTENIAKEMKLDSQIHFLGKRNDIFQIMPNCDVFLLPSLIEGLPGVILEAFVTKLPVVAYNVGGVKEVVKNKKTGFLVSKDDELGFITNLKNALSQDNSYLKNSAFELVTTHYSNESIAKKFIKFYENL